MALDKSGELWRGEDFADLADYIRHFQAEGYQVDQVVESVCGHCNGRAFRVLVDDTEGCAQRTCIGCGTTAFIADSAEYWDEADPGECQCPCGRASSPSPWAFRCATTATCAGSASGFAV
jgi:hypothetical protein